MDETPGASATVSLDENGGNDGDAMVILEIGTIGMIGTVTVFDRARVTRFSPSRAARIRDGRSVVALLAPVVLL